MKLNLQVTMQDGNTFEVSPTLFTVVAWERKYKRKASDMANGVGLEDLAFLAHSAAIHAGLSVPMMLDDFIKKADSIEVVGQEPENPTAQALTADS